MQQRMIVLFVTDQLYYIYIMLTVQTKSIKVLKTPC